MYDLLWTGQAWVRLYKRLNDDNIKYVVHLDLQTLDIRGGEVI